MFSRVGLRLAVLNAVVFAVILVAISGVLYLFTKERLYEKVDHTLQVNAQMMLHGPKYPFAHWPLRQAQLHFASTQPHFGQLPTVIIVWSATHQVIFQQPANTFSASGLHAIASALSERHPYNESVQGHDFRILNVGISAQDAAFLPRGGTVQIIRNIDDQTRELHALLVLILFSISAGLLAAIAAGWFLAQRALVPIRESWEKQQRFVSDASHELRTPLAVVKAQAQLLLRHPDHTVRQEASGISAIDKEARRMNQLVEDLLTLARADSNQLELSLEAVDVSEMLAGIEDLFQVLCVQKGLHITFDIEPHVVLLGDEKRLHQLVWILLDNALKYTPEGGRINVLCRRTETAVELSVSDTGVGIAKADLPYIFDRFYRGDKARSTEGTGLGLAIGKWIVDTHHGKLTVQSEVNQGTTMLVYFQVGKRFMPDEH
ncbi:sensor histidine kinase [Sulfoacidibacillus ferrooxidans]|uniref:histidine kinase n=1 Tax=Sulfoacidibacillus ferrooxidans TaxID=2005001 RepID=A0A9X2ABW7_9BACL|nr:ATP-binding protein [Sulfoacidibacillus ferrooxidans]MCI0183533.1 Adaptive-response sensory-kinase SasA [Sulfoacidibacillus ferrooxidans]